MVRRRGVVLSVEGLFTEYPNDRGEIDSARCMVLAETDCGQMHSELRVLINSVRALRDAPPRELFLSTMIANLREQLVGPDERQAHLAGQVGRAASRGARRCRAQAAACSRHCSTPLSASRAVRTARMP